MIRFLWKNPPQNEGVNIREKELEFLRKFEELGYREIPETEVESEIIHEVLKIQMHFMELFGRYNEKSWLDAELGKFSECLREAGKLKSEDFYHHVIKAIVKQVGANQGGLFLVDNPENELYHLSLAGCYAYNRKKFLFKTFEKGEGLVGQCLLEGSYILMTDVPQYYTTITSGLGEATPNCILIFPLIFEGMALGAIELASFQIISKIKIKFIEEVAKSLSSTLYTISQNKKIEQLYQNSLNNEAALIEKEEEIIQQMEVLKVANDDMKRYAAELELARITLEHRNTEIEEMKENEKVLLESKLEAQRESYELIINRLRTKLQTITA
jgi:hypothetical protein